MIIVGSITGNRNTLAGNIPPQADLGNLQGLKAGFKYPNVMINGGDWEAPKAYKDGKVSIIVHHGTIAFAHVCMACLGKLLCQICTMKCVEINLSELFCSCATCSQCSRCTSASMTRLA